MKGALWLSAPGPATPLYSCFLRLWREQAYETYVLFAYLAVCPLVCLCTVITRTRTWLRIPEKGISMLHFRGVLLDVDDG